MLLSDALAVRGCRVLHIIQHGERDGPVGLAGRALASAVAVFVHESKLSGRIPARADVEYLASTRSPNLLQARRRCRTS